MLCIIVILLFEEFLLESLSEEDLEPVNLGLKQRILFHVYKTRFKHLTRAALPEKKVPARLSKKVVLQRTGQQKWRDLGDAVVTSENLGMLGNRV